MPKITEAELKKHIKKKQFLPVYVIYGTEQLSIKRYTEMLTEAVAGKAPSDFNFHRFSGEINLDELAAAMQIVPFMSEYNCVLLTDIFLDSMDPDETARLKEILAQNISGTVVIISMPSYVPKKNTAVLTSIIKKAEKNGSVCKFEKPDKRTLVRYAVKWANENGKRISEINAIKLVEKCGDDLNLLKNEVNKISAYSKGEEISYEDIEKLAVVTREERIFALSDAVLYGNGDKAFSVLDMLFYQREEPVVILYVISTAFVDAYRVRVADECRIEQRQIVSDFDYKKRSFVLDRSRKATSRVSTTALRSCLEVLIEADYKFKSVTVNHRMYLEQLIAQLLMITRGGRAV